MSTSSKHMVIFTSGGVRRKSAFLWAPLQREASRKPTSISINSINNNSSISIASAWSRPAQDSMESIHKNARLGGGPKLAENSNSSLTSTVLLGPVLHRVLLWPSRWCQRMNEPSMSQSGGRWRRSGQLWILIIGQITCFQRRAEDPTWRRGRKNQCQVVREGNIRSHTAKMISSLEHVFLLHLIIFLTQFAELNILI